VDLVFGIAKTNRGSENLPDESESSMARESFFSILSVTGMNGYAIANHPLARLK
jgi:hypothetical protein